MGYPAPEFVVGPERRGIDPKPGVHLPASDLEGPNVRLTDQRLGQGRVDA